VLHGEAAKQWLRAALVESSGTSHDGRCSRLVPVMIGVVTHVGRCITM
jgi:hypothetical protein